MIKGHQNVGDGPTSTNITMIGDDGEPLARIAFEAEIIEWRGPAPYLFAPIPEEHTGEIRYSARMASYGWGVIPVEARVGPITFTTSLFPKDDAYVLPIKVAVQRAARIGIGAKVSVILEIKGR